MLTIVRDGSAMRFGLLRCFVLLHGVVMFCLYLLRLLQIGWCADHCAVLCSARIDRDDAWLTEWATSVAMAMHRAEADMRYVRTYAILTGAVRPTGEYRIAWLMMAVHCTALRCQCVRTVAVLQ